MLWTHRWKRHSTKDRVEVLIPAYQSAGFIDRTLFMARGQTHANIDILVSIDQCSDSTAEHVARHAAEDSRIKWVKHSERLGWAGNVNHLLSRVEAPYFFIYFHDDVLMPQYVERLLMVLQERTELASVHCDMGHIGADTPVSRGREMPWDSTRRLLNFMLSPYRSSPLRSLVRTAAGGHLRLPAKSRHGLWANEPFLLQLMAAGPAGHVTEQLYFRWDARPGGLTDSWKSLSIKALDRGWTSVIEECLQVIDGTADTTQECDALLLALYLKVYPNVRKIRQHFQPGEPLSPASIHPRFSTLPELQVLDHFGDDIRAWALKRAASIPPFNT